MIKSSLVKLMIVVSLVLPLSGCPGNAGIAYGVWFFVTQTSPSSPSFLSSLVILQNGFTMAPPDDYPGVAPDFRGAVVWEQNGSRITLTQDVGPIVLIFSGTVQSPTSMSGRFEEVGHVSNSGIWSATLDSES